MTLARDWRCPKCGYEQHEPIRVKSVSHPCHVNDKGERRTIPKDRDLQPVVDWSAPTGRVVQLTLEGAL